MAMRDLGTVPVPQAIPRPSPFASPVCYLQQLKFLAGLFLAMDRIRDSAPCNEAVREAILDIRQYPFPSERVTYNTSCGSVQECGMEWVIYTTSCNLGVNRLASNLKEKGIPLTILGKGTGWRGWGQRVRAYHDYLSTLPKHRLVVLTDGEDVILTPSCDSGEIVRRYRERTSAASPILVSAEAVCWPEGNLWHSYSKKEVVWRPEGMRDPRCALRTQEMPKPQGQERRLNDNPEIERRGAGGVSYGGGGPITPDLVKSLGCRPRDDHQWKFRFQYLNAGTMIGRAGDVAHLLRGIYRNDCIDDQLELSRAYLEPRRFWVDEVEELEDSGGLPVKEKGKKRKRSIADPLFDAVAKAMKDLDRAEMETGTTSPSSSPLYPYPDPVPHQRVLEARHRLGVALDAYDSETVWEEDLVSEKLGNGGKKRKRRVRRQSSAISSSTTSSSHTPLIALDFDNDLFAALYSVPFSDFIVNATAGTVRLKGETAGGTPCILHQNGAKVENRVLDEVAAMFGMEWSRKAVERARKLKEAAKGH
ncbi:hypothetical protein HDU67_000347 [Dinochytrium kinnereticum]|nr:hypothetical protein HDU67_000347 [Dinochytrium kinnereticum]